MTTALSTQIKSLSKHLALGGNEQELISTLKATAFKGADKITDAQMTMLLLIANEHKLNPWLSEIYAFPDKGAIVPIVGVNGWTRIINNHPQFDGVSFEQDDESCTCTIYRKDRSHPVSVTEYLSECFRPPFKNQSGYEIKGPWQTHPKRMLRHKALIQCARLAFSFTGIYDEDEAQRIVEADKPVHEPTMSTEELNNLVGLCEQEAKKGEAELREYWTETLTREQRTAIGTAELERIKGLSPIEAEFKEAQSE